MKITKLCIRFKNLFYSDDNYNENENDINIDYDIDTLFKMKFLNKDNDNDMKFIRDRNNFHIKAEIERQNSVCSNFIKKIILH